jgi:L-lactate dehydrogenase
MDISWRKRKVVIVGAGAVGSTFAYSLAQSGLADQIVLLDQNRDFAEGQVMDLVHGAAFFPSVDIRVGDASEYADASLIVMTAGAKQKPSESRLELMHRNASIVEKVMDDIVAQESSAVCLMVTNPVDILTRVAQKRSGWPRSRVISSGTFLDSARLRYTISRHCEVDVHNVHAYVLGEHGDSEFAAWSMTHIGGVNMESYCQVCGKCGDWASELVNIEEIVRRSAYHIIDYKGATWFAVGLALTRIADAILRNRKSVMTVSVYLQGEYGIDDVALSVPCIVSANGVEKIIEGRLTEKEQAALTRSADTLRSTAAQLEFGKPSALSS